MTHEPNPQAGAALALVQLLTEHPELPRATWYVGDESGDLHGHLHAEFDAFTEYVHLLGGSVRAAKNTRLVDGREVRSCWLTAMWRDVPVTVAITLPVQDAGLLAEQKHQLLDAPVPPLAVAA